MGAPPIAPAPPILLKASATTLVLSWAKATAPDQVYTLQLSDSISGHGFLNVYHGPENEYTCCGLYRNTSYLFRVSRVADFLFPYHLLAHTVYSLTVYFLLLYGIRRSSAASSK